MKYKKPISSNKMTFIEIIFENNSLSFKIDSFLQKSSTLSNQVIQEIFNKKRNYSHEIKFNKTSNLKIFDFLIDCQTKSQIWNDLVQNYIQILLSYDCFFNENTFLFFSYFLKEFKNYSEQNSRNVGSTDQIHNYVKEIITNGNHQKYPLTKKY